jgi:hypothetical protein
MNERLPMASSLRDVPDTDLPYGSLVPWVSQIND